MTDQRCETHVVVEIDGARKAIHFQSWWIEHHALLPALSFVPVGVEDARPAPGVLEAISAADVVLVAPSNPVVSIGTILAVPGIREALTATAASVVGFSPIIGGAPVRGMADACLKGIGVEVSAQAVAEHYGARLAGGLLDAWMVDEADDVVVPGIQVSQIPLYMLDDDAAGAMARSGVELVQR
jgi:LPPG:FO 2-phospho-L-lactate transferase